MIVMKSIRPTGEYSAQVRPDGTMECLRAAVAIATNTAAGGPFAGLFRRLVPTSYTAYADYRISLCNEEITLKPQPGIVPPGFACSGRRMLGLYTMDPRYSGIPISQEELRTIFGPAADRFGGKLLMVEAIFTPHSLGNFVGGRYDVVYEGKIATERLERVVLGTIRLQPVYPPSPATRGGPPRLGGSPPGGGS